MKALRTIGVMGILIFGLVACFAQEMERTWYVAPDGKDTNPGTLVAPFRTIRKGVSVLKAGDTLLVRAGLYTEAVMELSAGTQNRPITIAAYPGEKPVIDGRRELPEKERQPLVAILGSYVRLDGFEIRNSGGNKNGGLVLDGSHSVGSHLNVHHNGEAGVLARGDDTVVEDSVIWENAYANCRDPRCSPSQYTNDGGWATGVSAARNPADSRHITHRAILRRNVVYNNWGEGLSSYEAEGTILEDNVVYDNWATNTYISDSSNVVFQRNLIYTTAENPMGVRKACISLADERADKPRSENNAVLNNLCLDGDISAFSWTMVPDWGLNNVLIANNTVVNGRIKTGNKNRLGNIVNRNSRIVNNLVIDADATAMVPSADGLLFANNLWSNMPVAAALGTHSLVANPMLVAGGPTGAGKLTREYFALAPKSPARRAGMSLPGIVTVDALGHARKDPPTIGAYEIP